MEKFKTMWYNLRLKLVLRIKGDIQKTGYKKWMRVASYILFPIETLYLTNPHMQYDVRGDFFVLFGVKYPGDLFRRLRLPGQLLKVEEVTDGHVAVTNMGFVGKPTRKQRRSQKKGLTKRAK